MLQTLIYFVDYISKSISQVGYDELLTGSCAFNRGNEMLIVGGGQGESRRKIRRLFIQNHHTVITDIGLLDVDLTVGRCVYDEQTGQSYFCFGQNTEKTCHYRYKTSNIFRIIK